MVKVIAEQSFLDVMAKYTTESSDGILTLEEANTIKADLETKKSDPQAREDLKSLKQLIKTTLTTERMVGIYGFGKKAGFCGATSPIGMEVGLCQKTDERQLFAGRKDPSLCGYATPDGNQYGYFETPTKERPIVNGDKGGVQVFTNPADFADFEARTDITAYLDMSGRIFCVGDK